MYFGDNFCSTPAHTGVPSVLMFKFVHTCFLLRLGFTSKLALEKTLIENWMWTGFRCLYKSHLLGKTCCGYISCSTNDFTLRWVDPVAPPLYLFAFSHSSNFLRFVSFWYSLSSQFLQCTACLNNRWWKWNENVQLKSQFCKWCRATVKSCWEWASDLAFSC